MAVVERQVAASLKLKPTTDPAAERQARLAAVRTKVDAYADLHDLHDLRADAARLPAALT
ncbi:MAG: hypothetical protein IPG50_31725 [Myxococcales bacterium]|nr:hypothetical protein [Myxococcales bacterium]